MEFVRPDIDMVTVKGCLVKARYECQDASIAYFPNVEATPYGIGKKMFQDLTNNQKVKRQRKRSHSRESDSRKIPKSYDGDLSDYH